MIRSTIFLMMPNLAGQLNLLIELFDKKRNIYRYLKGFKGIYCVHSSAIVKKFVAPSSTTKKFGQATCCSV